MGQYAARHTDRRYRSEALPRGMPHCTKASLGCRDAVHVCLTATECRAVCLTAGSRAQGSEIFSIYKTFLYLSNILPVYGPASNSNKRLVLTIFMTSIACYEHHNYITTGPWMEANLSCRVPYRPVRYEPWTVGGDGPRYVPWSWSSPSFKPPPPHMLSYI